MKRLATNAGVILAVFALALAPGRAMAAVDLDLAFDPAEACPGDQVQFFFSIENVGDEAEMVSLSVTLSWGDTVIGPFTSQLPLAAGEEAAREVVFMVPPPTPPGTLVVDASATDSDGTVEATASLDIVECLAAAAPEKDAKRLLNEIARELRQIGLK